MPYLTIDGADWPVVEGSTRIEYVPVQQARRAINAALVVDDHGELIRVSVTIGPLHRAEASALLAALRAPGWRAIGGDALEDALAPGQTLAMHVEGRSRSDVAHRPPGAPATWMPQIEITLMQVAPS